MEHGSTERSEAERVTRSAEGPPAPTDAAEVKVWDPFVRIFHWSLVALFVTAYASAGQFDDVHNAAGYGILGLVIARVIWGIIGTSHARFSSFIQRPTIVWGFLRDTLYLRAKRYIGHNPAGGAMVVALLVALLAITGSGIMMTMDRYWGQKWIEEIHETAVHGTLILIGLHILGVVVASLEHRENLVRSMFTGKKRRDP